MGSAIYVRAVRTRIAWNRNVGLATLVMGVVWSGCRGEQPPETTGSGGSESDDGIAVADSGETSNGGDDGPMIRIDIPTPNTDADTGTNPGDCPSGGGTPGGNTFSIIWIANSAEGTVSKIDTRTATELARYRTGPDAPDPSRTSVNLVGDVAVANRAGSVTKIASAVERCIDRNQDGEITTSEGAEDILDWGEDECVLWHHATDFSTETSDNQGGPRAIAWDARGDASNPCQSNPNLWFGWRNQPHEQVIVRRLDGATGDPLDEVVVDAWQSVWNHGTYGGAADKDGGFWGLGTLGTLIYVDPVTLDVSRWDNPTSHTMYGLALDAQGTPWLAGYGGNLWKFDLDSHAFEDMGDTAGGPSVLRGLMIDGAGTAWIAGNSPCALVRFDTVAGELVDNAIELPGCSEPVGVSIDVEGMVWVVDRGASLAYKVDPTTYDVTTVTGLVRPYTYSDMTGAGLNLVVNPPVG